ncbi:MAG TPA: ABC transporter ATP-binding protein/permease [Xanthobacteraceae bacterium]|nr:ABC transporter ATP-binding protein/permease [Xanthobacteraceae bacterium]
MRSFWSTIAIVWRLSAPYFRSDERWPGRILLASVIAIELSLVGINVLLNAWNNAFYNALQDRNWDAFVTQLLYFCVLAAAFIVLAVYQLYLNQWLQIRWRRWMTERYLGHWLQNANHYRMQLLGDAADNPDQRIAEDIFMFVDRTLNVGIGLLSSVVTLVSFVFILWGLSNAAPLVLFGHQMAIPGYLVWAALIYAVLGTGLTHWIGWPLVHLNFMQQRYEADFRFNLVRVRENAEQIALLDGEQTETGRLLSRFGNVVSNWFAIMTRQKRLTFFTAGYSQVSIVFPYIVVSPAYFSGAMQLGGLMQTASAFNSVQSALSFFITTYRTLAEWVAVIERLEGFETAIAKAGAAAVSPPAIAVHAQPGLHAMQIDNLAVRLPDGRPLVDADRIRVQQGEHVLVTGPSGSGKSSLFRAIAGIWPFGSGTITVPSEAKLMLLPQRPYFPVARLASVIGYPAPPDSFKTDQVEDVLLAVGLPGMIGRLQDDGHWNRMLSLGEQQRLGLARALLHAPDFLFLDEATASLDEASEAALYRLLLERLARAAIVSIGHRTTLRAFHGRHLALVSSGDHYRVQESVLSATA